MTTSGTASGNEWQRVVQRVVQQVTTSGTASDNKWQWMTVRGYFGQFSFFSRGDY